MMSLVFVVFYTVIILHWIVFSLNPTVGITNMHIDALVQDCSNSNALAMELLQSCP